MKRETKKKHDREHSRGQAEGSPPEVAPSSLHQGQGPDFATQDKHLRMNNPAVEQSPAETQEPTLPPTEPKVRSNEPKKNTADSE